MRFIVTEELWALDALNPVEWHFLCELPNAAAGVGMDSSIVKKKLFPSPIDEGPELDLDSSQQIEDWEEYVQPEIETLFNDARTVVSKDIDSAETLPATEFFEEEELEEMAHQSDDLPDYRRMIVSRENTEAWYSVLNQARILMNEQHKIADSDERFAILMGSEEEDITPEHGMLLAQYEMYSAVQGILIENLMG